MHATHPTSHVKIYESIVAVMRDVEAIGKDRRNDAQRYQFRGIDDVYNELHSTLAKHGVFTVPRVLSERSEERLSKQGGTMIYRVLRIRFRFFAVDGSYVDAVVIGEGMDSGDKAANKAMSVAHKYAFLQVFAIPTADDKDPENDSHHVQSRSNSNNQNHAPANAAPDADPQRSKPNVAPAATKPADPPYDGRTEQFNFMVTHAKTYGIDAHDSHVELNRFLVDKKATSSTVRARIRDWMVAHFAKTNGVNDPAYFERIAADVANIPNKELGKAITDWLAEYQPNAV